MIKFPKEFVALRYPGYFWNKKEQQLYSMKVSGVLKPLKYQRSFRTIYKTLPAGYSISYRGRRFRIAVEHIDGFLVKDSTIPVINH